MLLVFDIRGWNDLECDVGDSGEGSEGKQMQVGQVLGFTHNSPRYITYFVDFDEKGRVAAYFQFSSDEVA